MAKPNIINKEDLIQYAKECLVNNGIEKFTLRAVAEIAGVTQGTIYYHFRTKEQLLLDIVKNVCECSWNEISEQSNQYIITQAIESAKSRCSHDSFFHKLFYTLVASSFHNDKIRSQLGEIIIKENSVLRESLLKLWGESPIEGISFEGWGVLINSVVDGVALQALLQKDFPVERTYQELEKLFIAVSKLHNKENK